MIRPDSSRLVSPSPQNASAYMLASLLLLRDTQPSNPRPVHQLFDGDHRGRSAQKSTFPTLDDSQAQGYKTPWEIMFSWGSKAVCSAAKIKKSNEIKDDLIMTVCPPSLAYFG